VYIYCQLENLNHLNKQHKLILRGAGKPNKKFSKMNMFELDKRKFFGIIMRCNFFKKTFPISILVV